MEADFIRLALFIGCVLIVLGVYFWSRRRSIDDRDDLIRRAYSHRDEEADSGLQTDEREKTWPAPLWRGGGESPIDQALSSGSIMERQEVEVEFVRLHAKDSNDEIEQPVPAEDETDSDNSFYDLLTREEEQEPDDILTHSSQIPLNVMEPERFDSEWDEVPGNDEAFAVDTSEPDEMGFEVESEPQPAELESEPEPGLEFEPEPESEPSLLTTEEPEIIQESVLNAPLLNTGHDEQQISLDDVAENERREEEHKRETPASSPLSTVLESSTETKKEPWLDLGEILNLQASHQVRIDNSSRTADTDSRPAYEPEAEDELDFDGRDELERLDAREQGTQAPALGEQTSFQFEIRDPPVLEKPPADLPGMLVQINIVARKGRIDGSGLAELVSDLDLRPGEMNIFHRVEKDGNRVVFSLANLVEPGDFPLNRMDEFSTPGVTLFTLFPGPVDSMVAYDDMLLTAKRIASAVGAELQDETHSVLSKQNIEHTRSQIQEHRRQVRLALVRRGKKRGR
jgi:cell division protein ZipA